MSEIRAVFCDGGVVGINGRASAGSWAYRLLSVDALDAPESAVVREASGVLTAAELRTATATNNVTELVAMVKPLLTEVPEGWSGTVYSDSLVTLGRFFQGWQLNNVPQWLAERMWAAQARIDLEHTRWVLLDGHPTRAQLEAGRGKRGNLVSIHNKWCDEACTAAGRAWKVEQGLIIGSLLEEVDGQ